VVKKLTREDRVQWLRALHYGDPKTGKSLYMSTANKLGRVAYWDCGSSANTILHDPEFTDIEDIWLIESIDDFSEMFNEFANGLCTEFDYLIIDELDSLWHSLMWERLVEVNKEKPNRSLYKAAMDDYGIVRNQMTYMVKEITKLPINLLVSSWVTEKARRSDRKKLLMPSLPGQLGEDIAGEFDVVGFHEIDIARKTGETTYKIHFAPNRDFIAGIRGIDRLERVGAECVNIDMTYFMERWLNQ
jgi:hypothetical protein